MIPSHRTGMFRIVPAFLFIATMADASLPSLRARPMGVAAQADEPSALVFSTISTVLLDVPASSMSGVAVAPDGSVYISDTRNNRILVRAPGGATRVLAGDAKPGLVDGVAGTARFSSPTALVFDRSREVLMVCDTGNHAIRTITYRGEVSTLAGTGKPGFADGPAREATFHAPMGIVVDESGTVFVADSLNHAIRMISPAGIVSVLANEAGKPGSTDGSAPLSRFHEPAGLALASLGGSRVLLIADRLNHAIRAIAVSTNAVSTISGAGQPGFLDDVGTKAMYAEPSAIVSYGATAWIADRANHAIRTLDLESGRVLTFAGIGKPGDGIGLLHQSAFKFPVALALEGALWIADTGNDAIKVAYPKPVVRAVEPNEGKDAGGEVVTLTGIGFTPEAEVRFGSSIAPIVAYTDTSRLSVTTPPGSGYVDVSVRAPGGDTGLSQGFRYGPALTGLRIEPAHRSAPPDSLLTFTAVATYSDLSERDVTQIASWTSDRSSVAEVVGAGTVRTLTEGSAEILAQFMTFAASGRVVVTALPPDPEESAPSIDRTRPTGFVESVSFLLEGPGATQRGLVGGALDSRRIAVIRGRVVDTAGPVSGVRVEVHGARDLGYTLSRADGEYDIAVNGGGPVVLTFQKSGYVPSHRTAIAPWQDFVNLADTRILSYDPKVATIDLADLTEPVEIIGSRTTDADGTRRPVAIFFPGTTAEARFGDGSVKPLPVMSVRMTEQSVGPEGAMPAELPPESGYTYCVELSADEAVAEGASEIRFTKPVALYVENFLGFRVGSAVPAGYYDRERAQWIASENGRVIRVLSVAGDLALIDANGDGTADDAYAAIGMTDDERRVIARLYESGASLWRVTVSHFTPWDFNWPCGPPADAVFPEVPEPDSSQSMESPFCQTGSVIECEDLSLGKSIPIAGTPFSLEYRSRNTPGYRSGGIEITLRTGDLPASVRSIHLQLEVAGRRTETAISPAGSRTFTFSWDGRDPYGREIVSSRTLSASIGYVYGAVYREPGDVPRAFGSLGSGAITGVPARQEVTLWRRFVVPVAGMPPDQGLGEWTLSEIHGYDNEGRTAFLGSGERLRLAARGAEHEALPSQDSFPHGLFAGPDGSLYTFSNVSGQLIRTRPDGTRTRLAGWASLEPGDGVPAYSADLAIRDAALLPDGDVVIVDDRVQKIFRIQGGVLRTVASGVSLTSVAPAPGGAIYFTDEGKVKRVDPGGAVSIVAEHPQNRFQQVRTVGDTLFIRMTEATNCGAGGCGYVDRVYRLQPSAGLLRVAPKDSCAQTNFAVSSSGRVFYRHGIECGGTSGVRVVEPDGSVHAYSSNPPLNGSALAVLPNGDVASLQRNTLACGGSYPCLFVSGIPVPAIEGGAYAVSLPSRGRAFTFSPLGKHLDTRDLMTGAIVQRITYQDSTGLPEQIVDAYGRVTRIERSVEGRAEAIVAPNGDRTSLVFAQDRIAEISGPGGTHRFTYQPDGLLATYRNPRGFETSYEYDSRGRLRRTSDPAGGWKQMSVERLADLERVRVETSEGRTWTYSSTRFDDASMERVRRDPAGLDSKVTMSPVQWKENAPDGSTLVLTRQPDSVWGAMAPFTSRLTLGVPSGRTLTVNRSRTVSTASPSDPFSVQTIVDSAAFNGRTVTTTYTANDRRRRTVSAAGRITDTFLDATGRTIEERLPGGPVVHYTYDERNRLASVREGTSEYRYGWNDRDQLESVAGPLAETVSFTYDEAGRVTTQVLPGNRAVRLSWDANGNLASVTPPGRPSHQISYSPVDLWKEYAPPGVEGVPSAATTFEYDSDRQLTRITRPDGVELSIAYDGGGRISSVTSPLGNTIYTYLSSGNVGSISATGSPRLTYAWDGFLPTGETWSGSVAGTVSSTWDNDFRLVSERVGTASISFGYDADSLLTSAGAMTISRDSASGRVVATSVGSTTERYGYDAEGRLESYVAAFGTTEIFRFFLRRDESDRITERREARYGVEMVETYGYDEARRLESVHRNGEIASSYSYDANGNRLARAAAGSSESGAYDEQDRLLSYGGASFTSTANGELATRADASGTTRYSYDVFGNLRKVILPDSREIEYVIDGTNRRVGRKIDGTLVQAWLYRNQLQPVAELDGAGRIVSRFVYATRANVPDYMIRDGAIYRIVSDHAGSVRYVVDAASGTLAQTIVYDEFGVVVQDTNPGFQPFGFAGGLSDPLTGLVRFGARDYMPAAGRWTSKDPILFWGLDPNVYAYVGNDPVNSEDPDGLAIKRCYRQFASTKLRLFTAGAYTFVPIWAVVSPPVPGVRSFLGHEYLYNTDLRESQGFDPRDDREETGRDICYEIPEPFGLCVWNNFEGTSGPREDYDFLKNNCQTTINETLKRCKKDITYQARP